MTLHKTKHFTFVNTSGGTRNGFYHESTLTYNGLQIRNRVNYINRTWERYTFQTSMRGALNQLHEIIIEKLKEQFKDMHNVKRMVAKQQELFKQFLEENLDQAINVQW